jgi:leucine dehydrogenase
MNDTMDKIGVESDVDQNFELFSDLSNMGHEQIVFCSKPEAGLKAIIAIHDTTLGPSLGGVRMWDYSSERDAIKDVLRLSRGMTYKSAISGLNLGGGKAVIIGDSRKDKSEALFRAFGRFVDGLSGRYITAEDVGISEQDMEWIFTETKYVTGIPKHMGGSGNPSPVTAYGVYMGMKAAANGLTEATRSPASGSASRARDRWHRTWPATFRKKMLKSSSRIFLRKKPRRRPAKPGQPL